MSSISSKHFLMVQGQLGEVLVFRAKYYKMDYQRGSRRYCIRFMPESGRWIGWRTEWKRDQVDDLPQKLILALWLAGRRDHWVPLGY